MARFHKRKTLVIVLGSLLVLLVAFRIALPYLVKNYLNRTLADLGEYAGHVHDVDIALIRGAYAIDSISIVKKSGKVPVPFFSASRIDLSVSWRDLFRGHLVSEIEVLQPRLNFVKGPTKALSQAGDDAPDWTDVVQGLFPIKINELRLRDGRVHYRDFHSTPKVNLYVDSLYGSVYNLTNSAEVSQTLFATLQAHARFMGQADLRINGKLDPYQSQPTFDLNTTLERIDLRTLNQMLRAYTKIDVEHGSFGLYSEVAAAQGKFKGYAKPIFENLKVLDLREDSKKGLTVVWEALVGAVTSLFQNHPKDRFAAQIPFEGSFDNVKVNVWAAIGSILRNTFIEALLPGLEQSIGIKDAADVVKDGDKDRQADKSPQERKQAREARREQRQKEREARQAKDDKDKDNQKPERQ